MSFVLPVSTIPFPGKIGGPYNSKVIFISRSIKHRQRYCVKHTKNVRYIHPDIEHLSEEYFSMIKENICIYNFYCPGHKRLVSLDYCLITCRWIMKSKCIVFKKLGWGCLACPHNENIKRCTKISGCAHRIITCKWISLYYSELLKLKHTIWKLTFKKAKNFHGRGHQVFDTIGHSNLRKYKCTQSLSQKISRARAKRRRRQYLKLLRKMADI